MIRVLIVEDSATVRRHLRMLIDSSPDCRVVGEVESAAEAISAVSTLRPDLVTLDVFTPGRSAAQVVRDLLATRPIPILLVSAAPKDTTEVFDALEAGALDFVKKPRVGDEPGCAALLGAVQALSRVKVRRRALSRTVSADGKIVRLVVIGSSTGGPAALRRLLSSLPRSFQIPIVIAQHLTRGFETGLAAWLTEACALDVQVARANETLVPGKVLLGRAHHDIFISGRTSVSVRTAGSLGYHPSADLLLSSAATVFAGEVIGVILTGVGADGLKGAEEVVAVGGRVLAQNRATSAVYGMPAAVATAGLTTSQGSPEELGQAITNLVAWSDTQAGRARRTFR